MQPGEKSRPHTPSISSFSLTHSHALSLQFRTHLHLIIQDGQHHLVQTANPEQEPDVLVPQDQLEPVKRAVDGPGNAAKTCGVLEFRRNTKFVNSVVRISLFFASTFATYGGGGGGQ